MTERKLFTFAILGIMGSMALIGFAIYKQYNLPDRDIYGLELFINGVPADKHNCNNHDANKWHTHSLLKVKI